MLDGKLVASAKTLANMIAADLHAVNPPEKINKNEEVTERGDHEGDDETNANKTDRHTPKQRKRNKSPDANFTQK